MKHPDRCVEDHKREAKNNNKKHTVTERSGWWLGLLILLLGLAGCIRPGANGADRSDDEAANQDATPTLAGTSAPATATSIKTETTATIIPPTATGPAVIDLPVFTLPAITPVPTPFSNETPATTCGLLLPLVPPDPLPVTDSILPDETAVAHLREIVPDAAQPALLHLLAEPENVGLVAYRVGQEEQGAYLNADVPMPLASVVKILNLVAYSEAVGNGQLDPLSVIELSELERYYLPGLDLGAHTRAVEELTENGRSYGQPPRILLDVVPEMMIRHSSNAAADYLHLRLGQETIENTAVAYGLSSQTAPCPFLGQFLSMANHTRDGNDYNVVQEFIERPEDYGEYAMLLTDAFSNDPDFQEQQISWRNRNRRPNGATQRLFIHNLSPQGSAQDYANLMARIALNGLNNEESSYFARRYLEWPMEFETNQELFQNLGYKNGSLPGVLTTAYYAYLPDEVWPVVVTLFYRDLPGSTYQEWRRNLAHDELARWLLSDPQAIPALRDVLEK